MARAEFIYTEFWEEVEDLSIWATNLFIWSWTNEKCNTAGLYRISRSSMTESKCDRAHLGGALAELAAGDFVFYEGGIMWVRNRIKHQEPRTNSNPNLAKSIAKYIGKIDADHPLRLACLERYAGATWLQEHLRPLLAETRMAMRKKEGALSPIEGPLDVDVDVAVDAGVVPLRTVGRS